MNLIQNWFIVQRIGDVVLHAFIQQLIIEAVSCCQAEETTATVLINHGCSTSESTLKLTTPKIYWTEECVFGLILADLFSRIDCQGCLRQFLRVIRFRLNLGGRGNCEQ